MFFVFICSEYAQLFQWDCNGTIITKPILYNMQPHLFNFFIHFNCLPPNIQGQNTTVKLANPKETKDTVKAVKKLEKLEELKIPLLVISILNPATREPLQYIIMPPHASLWVPVGHWT
jgi:hypothetical protein